MRYNACRRIGGSTRHMAVYRKANTFEFTLCHTHCTHIYVCVVKVISCYSSFPSSSFFLFIFFFLPLAPIFHSLSLSFPGSCAFIQSNRYTYQHTYKNQIREFLLFSFPRPSKKNIYFIRICLCVYISSTHFHPATP